MKTETYTRDGVFQLMLTPENDYEKQALKAVKENEASVSFFEGTFSDCQGGYTRLYKSEEMLCIRCEVKQ